MRYTFVVVGSVFFEEVRFRIFLGFGSLGIFAFVGFEKGVRGLFREFWEFLERVRFKLGIEVGLGVF